MNYWFIYTICFIITLRHVIILGFRKCKNDQSDLFEQILHPKSLILLALGLIPGINILVGIVIIFEYFLKYVLKMSFAEFLKKILFIR